MSLSAKKYFYILKYTDCNDCEFYHADTGYCEKACRQKRAYSNPCKEFVLGTFSADGLYNITEEERTEFNTIYRKVKLNGQL